MSSAPLTVLLTRPEGQGDDLLDALKAQQINAIHYPVMCISELDQQYFAVQRQHCKQQLMELDSFQHIIFISTNAVSYGMDAIEEYWPQLPIGIIWHAIGKATQVALGRRDAPVAVDSGLNSGTDSNVDSRALAMNSEALLESPQLQDIKGQKVLIVRGVGGRDYLQMQLESRGAYVQYAECYQRARANKPVGELATVIRSQAPDAVFIYSGESLQHFQALCGGDCLPTALPCPLVVPGQRVAALAGEQGYQHVIVADNAGAPAMIAAVKNVQT